MGTANSLLRSRRGFARPITAAVRSLSLPAALSPCRASLRLALPSRTVRVGHSAGLARSVFPTLEGTRRWNRLLRAAPFERSVQQERRSSRHLCRLDGVKVSAVLEHPGAQRSFTDGSTSPITLQRPPRILHAPPKRNLPNNQQEQTISTTAKPQSPARPLAPPEIEKEDPRQALIDSCPLTPVDELVVAAHMARLSNICYVPEPQEQLEALGLKLVATGKTYFTAWYVADGPDLSEVREEAPLPSLEDVSLQQGEGEHGHSASSKQRVRYILTHGVRWGASDMDSGRMWRQIMNCWPVDFPPPATRQQGKSARVGREDGLVAHAGILEIAEEVYSGVKPWLGGVEKDEVSAIRFGGHSLGGSIAALLMLLTKVRHGLEAGQVSAHLFGSPAFIARRSIARRVEPPRRRPIFLTQDAMQAPPEPGLATNRREGAIEGAMTSNVSQSERCPVLGKLGLPADAIHSVVLDKDMVPRMFLPADPSYDLLTKNLLVQGLLDWRERVWGRGALLTRDRFLFENVGLVHHIRTVGWEVLVRTLTSEQANVGLRLSVDDFVKQPLHVVKALFDHHRGHYSQDLEAAAAASKYRSRLLRQKSRQ